MLCAGVGCLFCFSHAWLYVPQGQQSYLVIQACRHETRGVRLVSS
jgi:hypothetical protein